MDNNNSSFEFTITPYIRNFIRNGKTVGDYFTLFTDGKTREQGIKKY